MKIWQNAERFDADRSSPITWMVSIARNRTIDEIRRVRPETTSENDDWPGIAADVSDPLAERDRREELACFLLSLDGLDDERRRTILLASCHDASRESLTERLGDPFPRSRPGSGVAWRN